MRFEQRSIRWILCFLFFSFSYYVNILASVVSGWRTPHMDPLPDLGHEYIRPYFDLFEHLYGQVFIRHLPDYFVILQISLLVIYLILFNPAYRSMVILRRTFVVAGIILLFRAYCVTVTNLPDMSPQCRIQFEKSFWLGTGHVNGRYKSLPIFPTAFNRANKLLFNPLKDTCGDLMFSGHTVALWLVTMIFYEYSSSRLFNVAMALVSTAGTITIVGTMFHYTLDVSVAIFVTYTTWITVHRYAKNYSLQLHSGYLGSMVHWFENQDDINEAKVYY